MNRRIDQLKAICLLFAMSAFVSCGSSSSSGGSDNPDGEKGLHENPCLASDIRSISRPIDPKNPSKGTFVYRAQIRQPQSKTDPVVVLIPGGPGQAWIGIKEEVTKLESTIPSNWGYMFTDPRGIGCNTVASPDLAFFKSENVAEDILEMIRDQGFQNYILYGVSYGTLVGQIAASKAEAMNMPKAKAVVHEGTIDKMFGSNYLQTYKNIWQETKKKMAPKNLEQFRNREYPLGKSASQWTLFLRQLMTAGVFKSNDGRYIEILDLVFNRLESENPKDQDNLKNYFEQIVGADEQESGGDDSGAMDFYMYIACSEIWNPMTGMMLDGENFQEATADACAKVTRTSSPYKSEDWKTTSPIYYFQGRRDPATPFAQARDQFVGQTSSAKRVFSFAERGGHNPMRLSMDDCQKDIWLATVNGEMEKAVKKCKLPGLSYELYEGTQYRGVTVVNAEDNSMYSAGRLSRQVERFDAKTPFNDKKVFLLKP